VVEVAVAVPVACSVKYPSGVGLDVRVKENVRCGWGVGLRLGVVGVNVHVGRRRHAVGRSSGVGHRRGEVGVAVRVK
jgi:hypothetical protein